MPRCTKHNPGYAKHKVSGQADITIAQLLDQFWVHADSYYRDSRGHPTAHINHFRAALDIGNGSTN